MQIERFKRKKVFQKIWLELIEFIIFFPSIKYEANIFYPHFIPDNKITYFLLAFYAKKPLNWKSPKMWKNEKRQSYWKEGERVAHHL